MSPGIFITFEGGEGSGKTTQIQQLARWLKKQGAQAVVTREPGGTRLADQIRRLLLDPKNKGIPPTLELLLYETARQDHVQKLISPALQQGKIVLCDRFIDATVAYQGYARGLSIQFIQSLNRLATGGLKPHLTFLFDLPVSVGLKRARRRARGVDRLEQEAARFHQRVRQGYLTLAQQEKRRFRIMDTRQPREVVFAQIVREIKKVFKC